MVDLRTTTKALNLVCREVPGRFVGIAVALGVTWVIGQINCMIAVLSRYDIRLNRVSLESCAMTRDKLFSSKFRRIDVWVSVVCVNYYYYHYYYLEYYLIYILLLQCSIHLLKLGENVSQDLQSQAQRRLHLINQVCCRYHMRLLRNEVHFSIASKLNLLHG